MSDSSQPAIAPWIFESLACPDCGANLDGRTQQLECPCGFSTESTSPIDLRPRNPIARHIEIVPGSRATRLLSDIPLERPALDVKSPPGARESSELFSALGAPAKADARLLDLGCGPRDQEEFARSLGFRYCGVDYASQAANFLADAHALPFRDRSFDVVFSYAVLEHLYSPTLALREVARVLEPGGLFIGTVSQGEPFHDSFFHHTSWGLLHNLDSAGLVPLRAWPVSDTLQALAIMGRYPRVGRSLIALVDVGSPGTELEFAL